MARHNVPTAMAKEHTDSKSALDDLETRSLPIVIKADGLAAGKGVTVATTKTQAIEAIKDSLDRAIFGTASSKILIEDFMEGEEASVFAICDGEKALPMVAAQDHKRAYDNDEGPNTGGMGAVTPLPFMNPELMSQIQTEVLDRMVQGLKKEGIPYRGLLYAGLMIKDNRARVVEFNARFGDPETQAVLRPLDEDLLDLCMQSAIGTLPDRPLRFLPGGAISVVLAAEGYPGDYKRDIPLKGIDNFQGDIILFHAGSKRSGGECYSTGGRILNFTAHAPSLKHARNRVYEALKSLSIPGTFYRQDIGARWC